MWLLLGVFQCFLKNRRLLLKDINERLLLKEKNVLLRGCSYGSELARLGGLARLGEMIFIPRSCGIFYLSSIKKFVKKIDQINSDVKPSSRTNVLLLFNI